MSGFFYAKLKCTATAEQGKIIKCSKIKKCRGKVKRFKAKLKGTRAKCNCIALGYYLDEGITGTKDARPEFQRMLEDCRAGKIDMVITKSITRFARNTVTLLSTIRELKALGVDVYFEKENIRTMDKQCEVLLTIMSSLAQEESRSISENVRWGQQRSMQEGNLANKDDVLILVDGENSGETFLCAEPGYMGSTFKGLFIPENWEWVRLDDIVIKEIRRGKPPVYDKNGTSLAFAQKCNTKYNGIDLSLAKALSDNSLKKYTESDAITKLDIIVNSTGTGTLGRVGIIGAEIGIGTNYYPDSHVTVVRTPKCISEFIYIILKSNEKYFEEKGEGSTNQKELKPLTIQNLLIPLPPVQEQTRIVEHLNKLMKNIDVMGELIASE